MANFGMPSIFSDVITDQIFRSNAFLSTLLGPTREETNAEWRERLRKENKPNPKFDTATAIKRVAALRKWVTQGRTLKIVQDVEPDEESWEDSALDEIGELESGLEYGPFLSARGRARG